MPSYTDSRGNPVVEFQPQFEISPFSVFRALRDGVELVLVDVRTQAGRWTLDGAISMPNPDWLPDQTETQVILFDDDGREALVQVQRMHAAGHESVRALFGGLELYEFALDPQVVGEQTYLIAADSGAPV